MKRSLKYLPFAERVNSPRWKFYLFCQDGACPVEDFLGDLPDADFDKFLDRCRRYAVVGKNANEQQFRYLKGREYKGIAEFKLRGGFRVLCFFCERKCILVEGCKKQSTGARSSNRAAYKRAKERRDAWLAFFLEKQNRG